MLPVLKDAILIAVISFSLSISLAALYSRKKKYKIDSTQELYALGMSSMVGSFFSCYPIAGSLSRTSVVANTGGKTQVYNSDI
jgi:MFS superfamily sulfate permease-like transporter